MQTFAASPAGMPVAEAEKGRVMQVSLPLGSSFLMGSGRDTEFGAPRVAGENFPIATKEQNTEHCDEIFTSLSVGGSVTMPLQEIFWGADYGLWSDIFSIGWMGHDTRTEG